MNKEALRLVSAWAIFLLKKSNLNDICHLTNFGVSDISVFGVKLVMICHGCEFCSQRCRRSKFSFFVLVCSLNAEGDDFISTWDEVHETFDVMGLHENLLRGIYAYGTGLSIKLNGTFLIFGNMCTSDSHYLVKLLDNFISFSCACGVYV